MASNNENNAEAWAGFIVTFMTVLIIILIVWIWAIQSDLNSANQMASYRQGVLLSKGIDIENPSGLPQPKQDTRVK